MNRTSTVVIDVSLREGQVTLEVSARTSCRKWKGFAIIVAALSAQVCPMKGEYDLLAVSVSGLQPREAFSCKDVFSSMAKEGRC